MVAIFVRSRPQGGKLKEDDLPAAIQNVLLAADSMGLGTCLIGFAVIPMMKDIRVKRSLGIPDNEKVHAVIAPGYPEERYLKVAGRKRSVPRYFETTRPNVKSS